MDNSIKIARQLIRIAKTILAFSKSEIERQLRNMHHLDEDGIQKNMDCIASLSPKEQRAALAWIRKKSMSLPDDMEAFSEAMKTLGKMTGRNSDFNQYDSPQDVLDRNKLFVEKTKSREIAKNDSYNPKKEKAFSFQKTIDGIDIYLVDDSKEGMRAVRKAIDCDPRFGYDKNIWCLASARRNFGKRQQDEIARMTDEQKERIGLYSDDDLAVAWNYWNGRYTAYPKRIAFKGNRLYAFSAGSTKDLVQWWNIRNKSSCYLPGTEGLEDNDFLERYGKKNLRMSQPTQEQFESDMKEGFRYHYSEENIVTSSMVDIALKKSLDKNTMQNLIYNFDLSDENLDYMMDNGGVEARRLLAEAKHMPQHIQTRLAKSKDEETLQILSMNDSISEETMRMLFQVEDSDVKCNLALQYDLPDDLKEKLSDDSNAEVRKSLARSCSLPEEIVMKLLRDKNEEVIGNMFLVFEDEDCPKYDFKKIFRTMMDEGRQFVTKCFMECYWFKEILNESPGFIDFDDMVTNYDHKYKPVIQEMIRDELYHRQMNADMHLDWNFRKIIKNNDIDEESKLQLIECMLDSNDMTYSDFEFITEQNNVKFGRLLSQQKNAIPYKIIRKLVSNFNDTEINLNICEQNNKLPEDIMLLIANNADSTVAEALMHNTCDNPMILDIILPKMTKYQYEDWLKYMHLSKKTALWIIEKNDTYLLVQLAENINLPREIYKRLAEIPDSSIKMALSKNSFFHG